MDDAVEPAELRAHRAGDVAEVVAARVGEIERQDRRLRMAGGDDFVVERFELAHDAAVQHDGGAARARRRSASGATEAAGGAGDQDRAAGEVDASGAWAAGSGIGRAAIGERGATADAGLARRATLAMIAIRRPR